MNAVRFYVVCEQGGWKIKYCTHEIGPFAAQELAVNAAIEAAHESGCHGHETQVVLLGEKGSFRIVWTYGDAPCGPSGTTKMPPA